MGSGDIMDLISFRFGDRYLSDGNCYLAVFLVEAVTITFTKILTMFDLVLLPRQMYDSVEKCVRCLKIQTVVEKCVRFLIFLNFAEKCVRVLKMKTF